MTNETKTCNTIQIRNVVATFKIDLQSPLDALSRLKCASHDPGTIRRVIIRLKKPKATYILFKSGDVICMGLDNLNVVDKIGKILIQKLRASGLHARLLSKPEIKNIVATTSLNTKVDLASLKECFENCYYEPEVYSSAILKRTSVDGKKFVIMVTNSGHIYCCGLSTYQTVVHSIKEFVADLCNVLSLSQESSLEDETLTSAKIN